MTSPAIWNHPSNIIGFCSKQTVFPDNWDSFFMIAVTTFLDSWDSFFMIVVTAFPDSWNNLFRIVVTADPATWTSLIFLYLAKTKTNYWNYLSLAKIPSFSVDFSPATFTRNSKIPFKEILPFFSQIHNVNAEWPLQQSEITHLTSLAFARSQQLSYNNCLMIAVTAFLDNWDSFFMIAIIVFPNN